jgi:hypothetical protein
MRRSNVMVGLGLSLITGCADERPSNDAGAGAGGHGSSGAPASAAGRGGDSGAAGSSPQSGDELCGKRPGGRLDGTHVLRFETLDEADAHVVVQIERAFSTWGVGESSVYELMGMQVVRGDDTTCISDAAALEYENTHHNWFDVARGRAQDATFELRVEFVSQLERNLRFEVVALDDAGTTTFGPVEVIGTGSPHFCTSCWDALTVSISEVMLDNRSTLADEAGDYQPWLELYNYGSEDVDLSGWSLSDDFSERRKWPFEGVTIPRHETLVVFADGEAEQGALHASFALSTESRQLILSDALGRSDGGILLAPPAADQSLAYSWTSGAYEASVPTPGTPPPSP